MTSEPVILLPDATVAEALALVRNPDLSPALAAQVFVVRPPQATPTGRFLGTAHMQRLLREPPSALVSGALSKDTDCARARYSDRRRSPAPRDLQPASPPRSSTITSGCSARCPSTTSSTTCCPRTGATSTRTDRARARDIHEAPDERRWLSVALGSTSPRRRGAAPRFATTRRRSAADRANRPLPRHRSLPHRADVRDHRLDRVQHAARDCRTSTRTRSCS